MTLLIMKRPQCWFVKVEKREHDKDRTQQHQFNGEPPLQEHMIFQVKDHGKAKDVLRVHYNTINQHPFFFSKITMEFLSN